MATRWLTTLNVGVIAAVALLITLTVGCVQESPTSQSDIAAVQSNQEMTPTPADEQATAVATSTPDAGVQTPVATPTPPEPIPPAITRALTDIYANIDWFQGVVTVTAKPGDPDSTSMTMRQWFRKPNRIKLEVIRSNANGVPVGSTFVYNGQTLTFYDPDQNQVFEITSRSQLMTFLNLPQERIFPLLQLFEAQTFLSDLSGQATVTVDGADTIAGAKTTIVTIRPQRQTPHLSSARLWLDDTTRVPLKAQAIRDDGSVLVDIEYLQFDATTEITESEFTFTPPTNATVVTPTPDDIARFANFQETTLQEAQSSAGFPILQPTTLPENMSQQMLRMGTYNGNSVVVFFYGETAENITTALIEKPVELQLPALRGAEFTDLDGVTAEIYQTQNMVVIDWIRGDTSLTLATTLSRNQALEIARSVR
ncbi:MAG: sigma-E factor regulatory protein RseB domain-containing protein [Chloroflexota bacterium]|jgi:outer membrane lipoprotein-sorting protein